VRSLGVARTPNEVLAASVERVRARLERLTSPLSPGGPERADAYLQTLHGKLDQLIAGGDPEPIRKWLASNPLFGPLVDALIDDLLDAPSDPETALAAFQVVRACAAVRSRVAPGEERHDDEHEESLRARMRAPGAFELLVEVAHDFRSPLTSILFLAEALRDGHSGPVTDIQRSQLGLVYSAAFGLASVASDVMDLARRERDLISDQTEPFSLAEVFRSVERLVRPLVEEKGLELRVVVPDRWQANGHPHAVSRVLLNLTTNALKFTDEGSVEIGVRPLPHARLEYYVQDTGRGISPEQQRDLFLPFKKRTGNRNEGHYFSGSGIGLSIARRLVRAMGSDLSLDSSDAKGTRFSFVLAAASGR
jgi:signal transduction histidine kinase